MAQLKRAMRAAPLLLAMAIALTAAATAAAPQAHALDLTVTTDAYGSPDGATDGKRVYYVSGSALYRKGAAGGAARKVKTLPKGSSLAPNWWSIGAAYKGDIFLNATCIYKGRIQVYRYNVKSGKLSKVLGRGKVHASAGGGYLVVNTRFHTDASSDTYVVYRVSKGKLKKVRALAKHGFGLVAIGGKLYFEQASDAFLSKDVKLYRTNKRGTAKKKLGGPWSRKGPIYAQSFTSKGCSMMMNGATYSFAFKTKKLHRVR